MPELEAVIGEDGALEPITGFAKTIDELARPIESPGSARSRARRRAAGARRWAAVALDSGKDAGVGGDDDDYY
jgi:hypothetical protein